MGKGLEMDWKIVGIGLEKSVGMEYMYVFYSVEKFFSVNSFFFFMAVTPERKLEYVASRTLDEVKASNKGVVKGA